MPTSILPALPQAINPVAIPNGAAVPPTPNTAAPSSYTHEQARAMFESAKKIVADSGVAIFGDLMHIPSQGTFCHFSSKATKKGLMLRFDSMFTSLSVLHHVLKSDRTFTDAEARKAGISDRGVEVRQ